MLHMGLLAFFPAAAIVASQSERLSRLGRIIAGAVRFRRQARGSERSASLQNSTRGPGWSLIAFCCVVAVGVMATMLAADSGARSYLRISKYSQTRQWNDLLAEVSKLPPDMYDRYVAEDVNRALYFRGMLPSKMFHYRQGKGVYSPEKGNLLPLLQRPYLSYHGIGYSRDRDKWFDMGHLHRSLLMCHELLELEGPRPYLLQKLSQIYLLKGRTKAARVFLHHLKRHLLFRTWADDYLHMIDEDQDLSFDRDLQRVKAIMLKRDHVYGELGAVSYEGKLRQAFKNNSNNRMAFEYLMGYWMRTNQLEIFIEHFKYLREFGYLELPSPYQEAVLIHLAATRDLSINLHGYTLKRTHLERGIEFDRIMATCMKPDGSIDKEAAIEKLLPDFGKSYFFFHKFGFSVARADSMPRDSITGATK